MQNHPLHRLLLLAGLPLLLVALVLAAGLGLPAAPAAAEDLPPRPTRVPSPQPTEPPSEDEDERDPTPAPLGRITGTVIDLTTGAPVPGVPVTVGDALVQTDANGNYDRNGLPAGAYVVALALTADQGEPAQAPLSLTLEPGAVLVQHLTFRSPAPAATATPTPDPTPTVEAAVLPQALPNSGAAPDAGTPGLALALALAALAGGVALRRAVTQ